MNDFLDELFLHCIQKEPPPRDARYQADRDALAQMEAQIEAAVGQEFWEQYIRAAFKCNSPFLCAKSYLNQSPSSNGYSSDNPASRNCICIS